MTIPQKKMLSQIETLREQLNNQVDKDNKISNSRRTLELSRKLDRLIYRYMENYLNNS